LTIDYVMRRNPLWEAATRLRESGLLGRLRHMDLANHAAGLSLPAGHWFWDKSRSGGIWIEHGVHFFDACAWVAGTNGEIGGAHEFQREDGATDRVECLARYGDAAAHFYHGFDHSGATEQTTVQVAFDRGYLTLHEWVPTLLELTTWGDAQQIAVLLPGQVTQRPLDNGRTRIVATLVEGKTAVYKASIQAGMRDLALAVRSPDHALSVTGAHGLNSLRMAVEAERLGKMR
jgi:predicted dehydrogenase